MSQPDARLLAVYGLHESHLRYGVERMALATLDGLQPHYRTLLLAPPGRSHEIAASRGIESQVIDGHTGFIRAFRAVLRRERELVLLTSSVEQSLAAAALNAVSRRRLIHIHVAHGGPEPAGFRRKRWLNHVPCCIVAVSDYIRRRLIAYGTNPAKITIIENFLDDARTERLSAIEHPPGRGIRRVLSLIKLEHWKRPHLIFDAIDARPELRDIEFRICGDGMLLHELRERARQYPNVGLPGFTDPDDELARADLLLHPNPEEPFGLVILEAMAAGVPILVADRGGAGEIVRDGHTGYHFRSDDAASLADRLAELLSVPPGELDAVAAAARAESAARYTAAACVEAFHCVIEEGRVADAPSHRGR